MPIDITNKEEKQIALTGTQIEETLLQAHLSKDAIEKINGLEATASEIDAVVLQTSKKFLKTKSTSSVVNLNNDYVLQSNGDYIEFVCKWNDYSKSQDGTVGILGKNDGNTTNTIGLLSGNLYMRGSTTTWMTYSLFDKLEPSVFNKFRLDVIGTNIKLTLNGNIIGSVALASPITINNIGNAYSVNYCNCTFQSLKINTSLNSFESENLLDDILSISATNTEIDTFLESDFSYNYNGVGTFSINKKHSRGYICNTFEYSKDTAKNSEVWRNKCVSLLDENFVVITPITNSGEMETAIMIQESGVEASDFIGGQTHGDELYTNFTAFLNGKKVDLTSINFGNIDKLEFMQSSNLFAPTGLSYVGTKVATYAKRWSFNKYGYHRLTSKLTWLYAVNLKYNYMFMIPIFRNFGGVNITNKFLVSDEYTVKDISIANHVNNTPYVGLSFGGALRMWGDVGISLDFNISKGLDSKSMFYVSNSASPAYNKAYYSYGNSTTTEIGESMETIVDFIIS